MSCQQSQQTDLMSFLADARSSEFTGFREHYPTCAECSAEVRVWTELHLLLGAARSEAHPSEERLLRFEQNPEALPDAQRRAIAAHLEACASCADELRSLHGFDFSQLDASPARRTPAWRRWLEQRLAEARSLVWHPAFAYALVLVLLYPIVAGEWRGATFSPPTQELAALDEESFERLEKSKGSDPGQQLEKYDADQQAPPEPPRARAGRTNAAKAVAPPPASPPAPRFERRRALAQEGESASRALLDAEAAAADVGRMNAPAQGGRMALAPPALAKRREMLGGAAESSWAAFSSIKMPVITLERGKRAELHAAEVRLGLRIRLPLPSDLGLGSRIEVRVAGPEGRSEIRERSTLGAGQTHLELRLPPGWVSAGTHQVELRVIGAPSEATPRFASSFAVR